MFLQSLRRRLHSRLCSEARQANQDQDGLDGPDVLDGLDGLEARQSRQVALPQSLGPMLY